MMQIHDGYQRSNGAAAQDEMPGWAFGLRDLYKVIDDEPLPSGFDDLLARLNNRATRACSH